MPDTLVPRVILNSVGFPDFIWFYHLLGAFSLRRISLHRFLCVRLELKSVNDWSSNNLDILQGDYDNSTMLDAEITIKIYDTWSTILHLKCCSDVLVSGFLITGKTDPLNLPHLESCFQYYMWTKTIKKVCVLFGLLPCFLIPLIPVSRLHGVIEFLLFSIFTFSFFAWIVNFSFSNIPQLKQYFFLLVFGLS